MNERDMNEIDQVRRLLREPPPPSAEASAKALTMLEDEMAPGGKRARLPRTGRLRSGWRLNAVAGVVAAGAAAAVAIATVGSGAGSQAPGTPSPPDSVALGKQAVLAAAEKAELQPTGTYWASDIIQGQAKIINAKTGAYAISGKTHETFAWRGVKSGMGEASYGRDLPSFPLTERDEALWRKAGSPSRFRVRTDGGYTTYTTKATPWRSDGPEAGIDPGGGGTFLGRPVEELQKLPTDPAELAEMFLRRRPAQKRLGIPEGDTPGLVAPDAQITRVSQLLSHVPIPPEVRAGLMRTLAAQPDIHAIGRATDPLDREGVALASDDRAPTTLGADGTRKAEPGAYRSRQVIIFDERTGALLSRQQVLTEPGGVYADVKPGFIIDYSTVRSAKWTDTKPKPPADLPF